MAAIGHRYSVGILADIDDGLPRRVTTEWLVSRRPARVVAVWWGPAVHVRPRTLLAAIS
jgi:hypothetical protein